MLYNFSTIFIHVPQQPYYHYPLLHGNAYNYNLYVCIQVPINEMQFREQFISIREEMGKYSIYWYPYYHIMADN